MDVILNLLVVFFAFSALILLQFRSLVIYSSFWTCTLNKMEAVIAIEFLKDRDD